MSTWELILVTLALVFCTNGLMAQDGRNTSLQTRRFDGLVRSLDDPSWVVRERSTRMLGNPNEGFELDMLAEVLERGDLTPETRVRLKNAARSLFGQSTKAGLGVGFGVSRDGGVEIGSVVADVDRFPAAGILMPGDLIVGAEGKPLTTSEELRSVILSHEPGDTLNLLIQRKDQVLDLDLPLGSYKFLAGAAPIIPSIADRAIEIRWSRHGVSMPERSTIGSGITTDDWIQAGYPEEPGSFRASNARRSPRIVSLGSGRSVFAGVGTVIRGRIEPWSNLTNAQGVISQARRIELSREMDIARSLVRIMKTNIKNINERQAVDQNDGTLQIKLNNAMSQLSTTQQKLDVLTAEFEFLNSSP